MLNAKEKDCCLANQYCKEKVAKLLSIRAFQICSYIKVQGEAK